MPAEGDVLFSPHVQRRSCLITNDLRNVNPVDRSLVACWYLLAPRARGRFDGDGKLTAIVVCIRGVFKLIHRLVKWKYGPP